MKVIDSKFVCEAVISVEVASDKIVDITICLDDDPEEIVEKIALGSVVTDHDQLFQLEKTILKTLVHLSKSEAQFYKSQNATLLNPNQTSDQLGTSAAGVSFRSKPEFQVPISKQVQLEKESLPPPPLQVEQPKVEDYEETFEENMQENSSEGDMKQSDSHVRGLMAPSLFGRKAPANLHLENDEFDSTSQSSEDSNVDDSGLDKQKETEKSESQEIESEAKSHPFDPQHRNSRKQKQHQLQDDTYGQQSPKTMKRKEFPQENAQMLYEEYQMYQQQIPAKNRDVKFQQQQMHQQQMQHLQKQQKQQLQTQHQMQRQQQQFVGRNGTDATRPSTRERGNPLPRQRSRSRSQEPQKKQYEDYFDDVEEQKGDDEMYGEHSLYANDKSTPKSAKEEKKGSSPRRSLKSFFPLGSSFLNRKGHRNSDAEVQSPTTQQATDTVEHEQDFGNQPPNYSHGYPKESHPPMRKQGPSRSRKEHENYLNYMKWVDSMSSPRRNNDRSTFFE